MVLTTLAYGTVHYWALAVFALSAMGILCLWCVDGLVLRSVLLSRNPLQWTLVGMIVLGLVQLLPLRAPENAGLSLSPAKALSLDPYATRLVLVQVASLLIYFAATLIFTDTPRRLRTLVRTVMIFAFFLAMFGLTQRRHASLLVSAVVAEHRLWALHQPPSFCRLYRARHRSSAGPVVFGRDRTLQASALRFCGRDDGRGSDHDEFTRRDYQSGS